MTDERVQGESIPAAPPAASVEVTLDSWKRLRALTDVVQEQEKENEHLDRKVRFALIVVGLLNGAVVFGLPQGWPGGSVGSLLIALALVDVYFFVHVIKALTPRLSSRGIAGSMGLRSSADIARADRDGYRRAWQEVGLDRLLAELAGQAHELGGSNARKTTMVRRLLLSLYAITALAVACIGWSILR